MLFYAGHGDFDKELDGSYWLPHEAERGKTHSYLYNERVFEFIGKIKTHHSVLILDSCFSGDIFVRNRSLGEAIEGQGSRWGLSSGRLGPVPDKILFFSHLLERLENAQEDVGFLDLANWVKKETERSSQKRQVPQVEPLVMEGNLFFSSANLSPRKMLALFCEVRLPTGKSASWKRHCPGRYCGENPLC